MRLGALAHCVRRRKRGRRPEGSGADGVVEGFYGVGSEDEGWGGGGGGGGGGGATYVRSAPLSFRYLIRYFGEDGELGMDLDETGPGPAARSLGRALLLLGREVRDGLGLRRRVTARKTRGADQATRGAGGESRRFGSAVVASLYHPDLDEGGELIIEPAPVDGGDTDCGMVGEVALEMIMQGIVKGDGDGGADRPGAPGVRDPPVRSPCADGGDRGRGRLHGQERRGSVALGGGIS